MTFVKAIHHIVHVKYAEHKLVKYQKNKKLRFLFSFEMFVVGICFVFIGQLVKIKAYYFLLACIND